ncbi:MAG: hypothetical protein IAF94_02365 [Pirellulaceae bacterium]|nr:hypothetical protein [Pirellulaceae bacterium]
MSKLITPLALAALLGLSWPAFADEKKEEKKEPTPFTVGEGAVAFKAPAAWTKKQPKSNIIEAEFEAPAAKGDEIAGRLTVMGAGGDIKANIDRWYGQFLQPDGSATKDKAKVEKKTVGGNPVHIVEITATYKDSPAGPFAGGKTVNREDFRMLAAIIETKAAGNYFIKFYGPKATIAENEKAFQELLLSLKVK